MRANRGARRLALLAMALLPSLSGCFFISGNINPFGGGPAPLEERVVAGIGKEKIVLIDVERTITAEEQQQAFGLRRRESTVARVEEELQKAAGDERVRAIVLRINSPGGSVTASDVIYHRLRQFAQERRVPIVAHMGDVAASGGYYVALAADEIVASPTSVTGSIGVILFGVNVEGLMSKLGVSNQTFKAGAHKDIGSPLRPMTKEESAILQTVLDSLQARFVGLVRERRPQFSGDAAYVDGRILTAEQALAGKLIDRIGYLDDALNAARQRAQLTQARVVMYRRPGEWGETIYSRAPLSGDTQVNLSLLNVDMSGLGFGTPRFMYLWWPAAE